MIAILGSAARRGEEAARLEKVIYRKRVRICLDCGRSAECPTPGAMPNCLYGNSTVANALVEHYSLLIKKIRLNSDFLSRTGKTIDWCRFIFPGIYLRFLGSGLYLRQT